MRVGKRHPALEVNLFCLFLVKMYSYHSRLIVLAPVGETICGGSGAGPSWHGTSGVHVNDLTLN